MKHHAIAGDGASLTDQPNARYSGRRIGTNTEIVRHADDGGTSPLPMRLDLRNHSPTGLEWGYGGSGPAQLALAIFADAIDDREAQRHYQDFKWAVIAKLDQGKPWEITRQQVMDCVGQQREQGR